jgi:predicted  nucleic acid-binding Zn-ribbon protein
MFEATCPNCNHRFPFDNEAVEIMCGKCGHLLYEFQDDCDEDGGDFPPDEQQRELLNLYSEYATNSKAVRENLAAIQRDEQIRRDTRTRLAILSRRRIIAVGWLAVIAYILWMSTQHNR